MKVNYHTHTTYCDGADTPQALVEEACVQGLDILGFSGHCYTQFDESYCMSREKTLQYRQEIEQLKSRYADRVKILCGIEQDYYAGQADDFDFVIGSVHYVYKNGVYIPVDESAEILQKGIEQCYNGDALAFAEDYFALVGEIVTVTNANIVGHLDLLTKFQERNEIFPIHHPRYRNAVKKAIEKIAKEHVLVEVNTGAMARGYRTTFYPQEWILTLLKQYEIAVVINSDCHNKKDLCYAFDVVQRAVMQAGVSIAEVLR